MKYIVDASVVLEWITASISEDSPANTLREKLTKNTVELAAPEFLFLEVTNVLYWKDKYSPREVEDFIEWLKSSGILFINTEADSIGKVIQLIYQYKITAYDVLYLLLAKEKKCRLITNDRELLKINTLAISIEGALQEIGKTTAAD